MEKAQRRLIIPAGYRRPRNLIPGLRKRLTRHLAPFYLFHLFGQPFLDALRD